ncbi:hypothetical protein SESBI_02650, partial [Sesbania bispinosa]
MKEPCTPKLPAGGKEEQESCVGQNSNKKRKSPGKVTPRKRSSKNSTPKKNVLDNETKGITSPKVDLRLEAKLSAEDLGKFKDVCRTANTSVFSSWKVGRKLKELADSEHSVSADKREGGRITCGPIHVFEDTQ